MTKQLIARIEDIGSARTILAKLLDHDLFLDLSKHNPYWNSEDSVAYEKLYDTRVGLSQIHDDLFEIYLLLKKDVSSEEL